MPNIPASHKKAFKSEKGSLFTPAGRLMYANLFTPVPPSKDETDEKKFKYQLTLLLPADCDISLLEKEVGHIIDEEHKPANSALRSKIKTPFIETASIESMAALADDFPFMLRLTSNAYEKSGAARQKPGVVDSALNKVDEDRGPDECYDGRWARCSVRPYGWKRDTGKGVSFGLVNVQLLWHDDPIGRANVKPENEFEAVEIDTEDYE